MAPIITDRKEGLWNKTLLAGVSFVEIMISQIFVNLIVMAIIFVGVLTFAVTVYKSTDIQSYLIILAILLLVGCSAMILGIFISTICPNLAIANTAVMTLFVIMSTNGGMFVTFEMLQETFQTIAYFLPVTIPAEAVKSVMIKKFGFFHPLVLKGFSVSTAWIVGGAVGGVWVLKLRKFSRNT